MAWVRRIAACFLATPCRWSSAPTADALRPIRRSAFLPGPPDADGRPGPETGGLRHDPCARPSGRSKRPEHGPLGHGPRPGPTGRPEHRNPSAGQGPYAGVRNILPPLRTTADDAAASLRGAGVGATAGLICRRRVTFHAAPRPAVWRCSHMARGIFPHSPYSGDGSVPDAGGLSGLRPAPQVEKQIEYLPSLSSLCGFGGGGGGGFQSALPHAPGGCGNTFGPQRQFAAGRGSASAYRSAPPAGRHTSVASPGCDLRVALYRPR